MDFAATIAISFWLVAVQFTGADEFTWTGNGGFRDWNDPANWKNITAGGGSDVDGIPDEDDEVTFSIDATTTDGFARDMTVDSDVFFQLDIGRLTIGDGTGEVRSINNSGRIRFVSSTVEQRLAIVGEVQLVGGGEIIMTQEFDSRIDNGGNGLLRNVDQSLRGEGAVYVPFVNESVVSIFGDRLLFWDTFDNSNGTVLINSTGELQTSLEHPMFGGVIDGSIGGRIRGGYRDVTFERFPCIDNSATFFSGSINNTGRIDFEPNTSGWETLTIVGTVDFVGEGEVRMAESPDSRILDGGDGLVRNIDNRFRGAGVIQVPFVNFAEICPEDGIMAFSEGLDNTRGEIQILSGGRLRGDEDFPIFGGIIDGFAGSVIEGSFTNTTFVGGTRIGATPATFIDTIVNEASISFGSVGTLMISGELSLIGNGSLSLFGQTSASIIDAGDGTGLIINQGNLISGTGSVQVPLVNVGGELRPFNGLLSFTRSVDNSAGNIHIEDNGRLRGSEIEPIVGGTIFGEPGAVIEGGYRNVAFTGDLIVGYLDAAFCGDITNDSLIEFQNDTPFGDRELKLFGEVTMMGAGEIVLTDFDDAFIVDGGDGLLRNEGNTIRGIGEIQVPVINAGKILADKNGLHFLQQVDLDPENSVVSTVLDGSQFDASGFLTFDAALNLAGELQLVVGENFNAEIGDSYEILSAVQLTGEFSSVDQTKVQTEFFGYEFAVNYTDNVFVEVTDKYLMAT